MSIKVERKTRSIFITLDRPPLNVLDLYMLRQLRDVFESMKIDNDVDILVLQGEGERAFSAGVDVRDHTQEKVPEMLEVIHGAIRQLLSLPQITIACVQGACLGGGCELANSCDFILASENSSFATPEINVGCFPPVALSRFPTQIGYHRAVEMILTGRQYTALEAQAMGMVNRVVPAEELNSALQCLIDELQSKSGQVLRIALKGLRELSMKNLIKHLERAEEIYLNDLLKTEDVKEGVQAFLEKRMPQWKNR